MLSLSLTAVMENHSKYENSQAKWLLQILMECKASTYPPKTSSTTSHVVLMLPYLQHTTMTSLKGVSRTRVQLPQLLYPS